MYEDASALLDLMDKSAKKQREDLRRVAEQNMDHSDRVVATLAAVRTIDEGSKILETIGSDPTSWQTRQS